MLRYYLVLQGYFIIDEVKRVRVLFLLRPGKSQVTTVGILPNKHSQLARYCLVWGIRPVYGPATVGQVTVKAYFTGCGSVHRLSVFFSFMFMYVMQVPN